MSKNWKRFWMVCGSVSLFGMVLIILGVILGASFSDISNRYPFSIGLNRQSWIADYEENGPVKLVDNYSEIKNIDFELTSGTLRISEYDEDTIKVEKQSISRSMEFECYEKDGTLFIETNQRISWGINSGKATVFVYVPRGTKFNEADISVGAGRLIIENINSDNLEVSTGAGTIEVNNFNTQTLDGGCGAGTMILNGNVEKRADIDCGVGEIEMLLTKSKEDYNYSVTCGIGKIKIGDEFFDGLINSKRINNKQERNLDFKCGTGDINVTFLGEEGGDL